MFGKCVKIYWGLMALINGPFLGSLGKFCYIGKPCYIANKKDIFFGNKVRVYPGLRCETLGGGKLIVGDNVSIGQNFHVVAARDSLKIGNDVTISGNVFISNCDHMFNNDNLNTLEQPVKVRDTIIGDYTFIGYGSVVMAGTSIGKHCVIGANSVVRGSFPDNTMIAGVPAKIIKRFDSNTKEWIKV